jgi:hypothetical protein
MLPIKDKWKIEGINKKNNEEKKYKIQYPDLNPFINNKHKEYIKHRKANAKRIFILGLKLAPFLYAL